MGPGSSLTVGPGVPVAPAPGGTAFRSSGAQPLPSENTGSQREPTIPRTGKWAYLSPRNAAILPISTASQSLQRYRADSTFLQEYTY